MGFQAEDMNLLFDIKKETAPDISGLIYISDFITGDEEMRSSQRDLSISPGHVHAAQLPDHHIDLLSHGRQ